MIFEFNVGEGSTVHQAIDAKAAAQCVGIVDGEAIMQCDAQHLHAVINVFAACGEPMVSLRPTT